MVVDVAVYGLFRFGFGFGFGWTGSLGLITLDPLHQLAHALVVGEVVGFVVGYECDQCLVELLLSDWLSTSHLEFVVQAVEVWGEVLARALSVFVIF